MDKKLFKKLAEKCAICEETESVLFDVHRIHEGKEYAVGNCIAICVRCHRLHHAGKIKIKSKNYSTAGQVLIYEQDGNEIIKII